MEPAVLSDAEQVAAALSPLRRRLLEALARPDSAAGLARRLDLPRQKVNYHVRALERAGCVELLEERQRRGCVERVMRVTAPAFFVSPTLLGPGSDPDGAQDRFSSAYLVGRAARLLEDVAVQRERAAAARRRLVTLTLETDVRFESPDRLREFAAELGEALGRLAARHGARRGRRARRYRFVLAAHPAPARRGKR